MSGLTDVFGKRNPLAPPTASPSGNLSASGSTSLDGLKGDVAGGLPGATSTGQAAPNNPALSGQVYWGDTWDLGNKDHPYTPNHIDANQAANDWYQWSDEERKAFTKKLYDANIISNPTDYSAAQTKWIYAVSEAANFYQVDPNKAVSPWDVIDMMGVPTGNTSGSGSVNANATIRDTSTQTQAIDKDTAHSIVRDIFQKGLGRDPTTNEMSRYGGLITGYTQDHPQTTTRTTKYDGQGRQISQTADQSGGYSQAGLSDNLLQQAKADPEYGAYQAATTYYNALLQAMGGSGG